MAIPSPARQHQAAVIVIDDSPADLRWFQIMTEESGIPCSLKVYPTLLAATSDLARDTAASYSGVFINAVLPSTTLEDACAELRAAPQLAGAPIVVMVDGAHEVEMARQAGLKHWIWKPVDPSALEAIIEHILEHDGAPVT